MNAWLQDWVAHLAACAAIMTWPGAVWIVSIASVLITAFGYVAGGVRAVWHEWLGREHKRTTP